MTRVKLFAPTALLIAIGLLLPMSAAAQPASTDDPQIDQPTSAPTNIQPAGVAVQDWEIATEAIKSVPSPIGSALPGFVYVQVGIRGVDAKLFLDAKSQRYSYDCAAGRCTGFAPDLWRALPAVDQRGYIDAVLDALMQSFPDLGIYRVTLDGIGTASWDAQHGRAYRFNPPL